MNGLDLIIADEPHRRKWQLRLADMSAAKQAAFGRSFTPAAALAALLGCLIWHHSPDGKVHRETRQAGNSLEIGRCTAFALSALDKIIQLLANGRIHRQVRA